MTLRALIFDLDGTLVDTEEAHRQAFNAAFIELDLWWDWSPELYAHLLRVSGGKARIVQYLKTLPISSVERARTLASVDLIHATKTRIYQELLEQFKLPPRPGVAKLIGQARAAGVRLAIASTTASANLEVLLNSALGRGAMGWFSTIAAGDSVANNKPAPDIYRRALEGLRLPADACMAFEDSVNGLRAARAEGLFTVVVPTRWNASRKFTAAQLQFNTLEQADLRLLDSLHADWHGSGAASTHCGN